MTIVVYGGVRKLPDIIKTICVPKINGGPIGLLCAFRVSCIIIKAFNIGPPTSKIPTKPVHKD